MTGRHTATPLKNAPPPCRATIRVPAVVGGRVAVAEVVDEFDEKRVKLVAVNLQEDGQTIDTTLERLGVHLVVIMDRDGAVGMAYQAQAIPQTVVIDQQGRVTHVFVGDGQEMGAQLRQAIQG